MIVADVDWDLLARQGPAWMGYWDRHVRGTGRQGGASDSIPPARAAGQAVRRHGGRERPLARARAGRDLALLGPSGSGKTTTLRLLAGFETPDSGRVLGRGRGRDRRRARAPALRDGLPALRAVPALDVGENVAFGLGVARRPRAPAAADRARRWRWWISRASSARRIGQLSGGQQQRVALARALAPEPRVLLLDEPLSNLDPTLRERTRRELRELIRRVGITTVLVTHEQDEAFDLGDRVAVLRAGGLEQVGTPEELYGAPAKRFVGGFIGRSSTAEVTVIGPRTWRVGSRWMASSGTLDAVPGGLPAAGSGGHAGAPRGAAFAAGNERARSRPPSSPGASPAHRRSSRRAPTGARVLEVVAPPRAVPAGARVGLMPSRRVGGGIHLFPRRRRMSAAARARSLPPCCSSASCGWSRIPSCSCRSRASAAPLAGHCEYVRQFLAGRPSGRRSGAASGSRSRAWCSPRLIGVPLAFLFERYDFRAGACSAGWWRCRGAAAARRRARVPLPLRRDRVRLAAGAAAARAAPIRRGGCRAPARSCSSTPTRCTSTSTCSPGRRCRAGRLAVRGGRELGAGRWRTLRRVVLPLLAPRSAARRCSPS